MQKQEVKELIYDKTFGAAKSTLSNGLKLRTKK